MGELREGVWVRPDNLDRPVDPEVAERCRLFTARPDSAGLAETLWDLPGWADGARRLRERLDLDLDLADRFVLASETLRHLLTDPLLPPELAPPGWPADDLRRRYLAVEADVAGQIRRSGEP